jgi:hypothetical protein
MKLIIIKLFESEKKLLNLNLIIFIQSSKSRFGRAIAQAVSRWLPTAAARVQTRV